MCGLIPPTEGHLRWKQKNTVLHVTQNSKHLCTAYCKSGRLLRHLGLKDNPVLSDHLLDLSRHKRKGWAPQILGLISPLVIKLFGSWYLCSVSRETPLRSQPRSGSRATIPGLGTLGVSSYQGAESRGNFSTPLRWGLTRRKVGQLKWHFSTNVRWKDGNSTTEAPMGNAKMRRKSFCSRLARDDAWETHFSSTALWW